MISSRTHLGFFVFAMSYELTAMSLNNYPPARKTSTDIESPSLRGVESSLG